MTSFSPREIVSELDRFIVGQNDAKRAVAIALRNRWRRQQLTRELREEVLPKNILMIGPTGCGKTEIARRLARLAQAPFLKVEATKFTEVGYVGRDVEQIVRDLVEIAIAMTRERLRKEVEPKAELAAEERVLDALVGDQRQRRHPPEIPQDAARGRARRPRDRDRGAGERGGEPADLRDPRHARRADGHAQSRRHVRQGVRRARTKPQKMTVADSHRVLMAEESDKLLDQEKVVREAIAMVEQNGIVFLDEIDKICGRSERARIWRADVSREGVQRDLLPLIEGTTVATKHGAVKTDHILFIASGAFHLAKPSDLLPELQGRLPIRVELKALDRDDFRRILTEPEASLIKQYKALLATEGVKLDFDRGGDRRDGLARRGDQRRGREYRRAAAAHDPGAAARGDQLHRLRPARRHPDPDRPRLCARPGRRAGEERRSLEIHPVTPDSQARLGLRHHLGFPDAFRAGLRLPGTDKGADRQVRGVREVFAAVLHIVYVPSSAELARRGSMFVLTIPGRTPRGGGV